MNLAGLPIGLVFDHTVVAAYAQGDKLVETWVKEAVDIDYGIAIPQLAIVEAAAYGASVDRIFEGLLWDIGIEVDAEPVDIREWADFAHALGSTARASAVLLAREHGCAVLTTTPAVYGDLIRAVNFE